MALDFDASSLRARPAKRSRLEADRRRDMFQRVANKFADIDFTKYQYLHARTTDAAMEGVEAFLEKREMNWE